MDNEARQRLNARAIQASFHAAMDSTGTQLAARHIASANELLERARLSATTDFVRAYIDGVQDEIDARTQPLGPATRSRGILVPGLAPPGLPAAA